MAYDNQNIFAKILRGEIPCDKVYEDDYALAFNDINPARPVHILVIPKGPYVSMDDFSAKGTTEELAGFLKALGHVAREAGVTDTGYRIIGNNGAHGHQEVPHLHLHILGGASAGPMVKRVEKL
ncbi:MAG: histidine triad nucleotide-binding protein [Rhodospirillales bacterium]|nr:histidine triad nucleotide-binding protein [Rhodospirillales bacterium]